jgi:tRNA pseudouridine55 synthase
MDGILIINKPGGITSYQVVHTVKRATGAAKVGHGGTLDPLATGVLPIFLNKATRLVPHLMNGIKKYRAVMELGVETDTQDREGKIIAENRLLPVDPLRIAAAVHSFKGVIEQTPPMYSALKHNGTPLYKLARKGICLERAARTAHIYDIKVLEVRLPLVTFEADCSPGTYIRTLCADIGRALGCGAHLASLTRLQCGSFGLDEAMDFDDVPSLGEAEVLRRRLVALGQSLIHLPLVLVTDQVMALLRTRKTIAAAQLKNAPSPLPQQEGLLRAGCDGDQEIALVQSLVSRKALPALPDTDAAWKRICFYNPHENTIH